MAIHKDLGDAELHEPKGMQTLVAGAADVGKVAVSKGDGTSEVRKLDYSELDNLPTIPTRVNGFGDYNDTTTGSTPITLSANTWTTITNDGAGAFTNLSYLPTGVTQLMDTSTGSFDFSELALGDVVMIRNDFTVTPSTNNALLELRYQLGNGGGLYTLTTIIGRLDSGSGQPYRYSLVPQMIYMGDTNTRDNPVTLQLRLSSNGSVTNAGSAIGVTVR